MGVIVVDDNACSISLCDVHVLVSHMLSHCNFFIGWDGS